MLKKPKILVVGSLNMDLIISTGKFPASGETVMGCAFSTAAGGKGANQAVQAALLGAEVTMVGKVGDDAFGKELLASAAAAGINTSHILVDGEKPTGTAAILLEVEEGKKAKNRIIIVSGTNMAITPADIEFLREGIAEYDMVMLQLEIAMDINILVAQFAHAKGVPVMLNSAPYAPLPAELLSHITYISPNEHEAADLTGVSIRSDKSGVNMEDVRAATAKLLTLGVQNAIITLGSNGAVLTNADESIYAPCVDIVQVKDPTAAGDSFVGGFCTAVAAGLSHGEALEFASYTATLTVSRMGAQPSLPTLAEVTALMKQDGKTPPDMIQ
ncbi:MAG: ribokinase [Angelakisella sp.]